MNQINSIITTEKKDLHIAIDNSFNHILRSLEFIFEGIKYNEVQYLEEANDLELSTSILTISNELNYLLKLINDMKGKFIKSYEPKKMNKQRQKDLNKDKQDILIRLNLLQELHNEMNHNLKEWKLTKAWKISASLYGDNSK